ncbi:MAG TPA: heme lyase CcmF/NrfE family subunit [Candidatus Acidoferrum sp.]|nr:heme lyase CcmF/NrfE family subunit [Candidatus Acidoferrum sp.]
MDVFGSFALLLAFVCALYALAGGIAAILTRHPLLIKSARQAGMAACALIFLATFSVVYLFVTDNFSMAYVASHSNRDLATFFKVVALWSGQEGSLLFWCFLMSIYIFSVLIAYRNKHGELMPYVGTILAGVQLFFLTISNFVASPFKALAIANASGGLEYYMRGDGSGLNPVLQYPEMIIHPPNLYSGYTGFTIPFAFALAALLGRYPGEKWIHLTRKWTMIAWCFQTVGILLGAHWAYAVLGWGGYWGWDPVENASFLPWLTGTAFLHSVMMQEKRGMMKIWNVWLVFITFMLCILGTLLTRSGVVSSVHAFAQSNIGNWFVGFLAVVLAICLFAFFKNRDYLESENQLDSMISRESSFLFNNLVLLVACVAILSGTLFPVFSEWFTGSRISVGAPFFNKVNIPLGLLLLFLTGVGPLLAWRKTSAESLKRNLLWPALVGLAGGVIVVLLGAASFDKVNIRIGLLLFLLSGVCRLLALRKSSFENLNRILLLLTVVGLLGGLIVILLGSREMFALVCFILSAFVAATIAVEYYRGARVIRARSGLSWLSSAMELTLRNTRRYGGYIVHFGMVMIFVGLAGQAFNKEVQKEIGVGGTVKIGPYELLLQAIDQKQEKNYVAERMIVEVMKDHKPVMILFPERRNFPTNQESGTMVAIYSTLREDLYVVYAGINQGSDVPTIHVFLNPLVKWVWYGGIVVVMGTIVALVAPRHAVLVLSGSKVPEAVAGFATAVPNSVATSVTLREGHD